MENSGQFELIHHRLDKLRISFLTIFALISQFWIGGLEFLDSKPAISVANCPVVHLSKKINGSHSFVLCE